jgi:hypothetical protein
VEPDSTAGFKQRALVEMQETAKALVRNNKKELPAARTLEVSLDRADNVIDGGTPFYTTEADAFDFKRAELFAPLFHAKGAGLGYPPPHTT